MTPEMKEAVFEYLRENLKVVVTLKNENQYVGSMGDGNGSLYKDYYDLRTSLELEGEEISYESVSFSA